MKSLSAVFVLGMTAAISLMPGANARAEITPLSDYFAVKRISGGIGVNKWEATEIYVPSPGKEPEYIGTIVGGPPRGMGPFSDATKGLRAISMAVSKDGRSLIFRHWGARAQRGSKLESGIYQVLHGTGIKLLYGEKELPGISWTDWEKAFPTDVLPLQGRASYGGAGGMTWALKTTGEKYPLGLYEASPLHWAAFEGRAEECAALLKGGADIDVKTYWEFTPLDLAIIRGHQDTAIQLLALGANPNSGIYPAFHRAVMLGRMNVVQAMVERGADIHAIDEHGYTPLHLAVFAGTRQVGGMAKFFEDPDLRHSITASMTTKLVQLLLDKGANPAVRDKYGKTPLDAAVGTKTPIEVHELLSKRAKSQ